MPILESIAAANAAYAVIKTCVSNGREAADLIAQVGKFVGAEEDIKRSLEKQKNSPLSKILGKDASDFEQFQQLEDLKRKRMELESMIRLYGSPGMFDRWVSYQAKARAERRAQEKKRNERRTFIVETSMIVVLLAVIGGILFFMAYVFARSKGYV